MNKVISDKPTLNRIRDLGERAELCDDNGHTVWYFVPFSGTRRDETDVPYAEED